MYSSRTSLLAQVPTDRPLPQLLRLTSVMLYWPFVPYFSRLCPSCWLPKPFNHSLVAHTCCLLRSTAPAVTVDVSELLTLPGLLFAFSLNSAPPVPPGSWHLQSRKNDYLVTSSSEMEAAAFACCSLPGLPVGVWVVVGVDCRQVGEHLSACSITKHALCLKRRRCWVFMTRIQISPFFCFVSKPGMRVEQLRCGEHPGQGTPLQTTSRPAQQVAAGPGRLMEGTPSWSHRWKGRDKFSGCGYQKDHGPHCAGRSLECLPPSLGRLVLSFARNNFLKVKAVCLSLVLR